MTDLLNKLQAAEAGSPAMGLHKQSECPVCDRTSMVCEWCGYGGALRCKTPDDVCGKQILCIACAPDEQFALLKATDTGGGGDAD